MVVRRTGSPGEPGSSNLSRTVTVQYDATESIAGREVRNVVSKLLSISLCHGTHIGSATGGLLFLDAIVEQRLQAYWARLSDINDSESMITEDEGSQRRRSG